MRISSVARLLALLASLSLSRLGLAETPLADTVERLARSTLRSVAKEGGSPAAASAEHPSRTTIQSLLAAATDLNLAQADGMTALHWAVYADELDLARQLIERGASADSKNRYGVTPLSLACTNGNAKLVELLLKAGADPKSSLKGGETVLMTAARTGDIACVRLLLDGGAPINATDDKGQTALMWAAAEGYARVVDALLDAGAEFKKPLPSGFTPLFFAVREGQTAVVRRLLNAGEDVNQAMLPERTNDRSPDPGISPLILAVENGHFELAIDLVKAGADPNDQRVGYTALHILSTVRKPPRGDDVAGAPPPIGSGKLTSLQFVRALVALGADVNRRLERGRGAKGKFSRKETTPFFLAADTADIAYMKLLVELGADPLIPNAAGCTPLMVAAGIGTSAPAEEAGSEEEALEAVAFILARGGDINTVDENGETAMHGAAYKNIPRMVTFLAEHGADIKVWNRANKLGLTPLKIAYGYRPGNFRPSPDTIAAIQRAMLSAGVTPPDDDKLTPAALKTEYAPPKNKTP